MAQSVGCKPMFAKGFRFIEYVLKDILVNYNLILRFLYVLMYFEP